MKTHIVEQGEYLSLIGDRYGTSWQRIWNHPANEDIRNRRKSPNILHPGDELKIPDIEIREESVRTGVAHRFILERKPQIFRLVLRDSFDQPMEGMEYELEIPGHDPIKKETGADGLIEAEIPKGVSKIKMNALGKEFDIEVGSLDPVAHLTGVQQRLKNLNFDCGSVDADLGPKTRSALIRFQRWVGLPPSGLADEATRKGLEEHHEGRSLAPTPQDGEGEPIEKVEVVEDEDSSSDLALVDASEDDEIYDDADLDESELDED